MKATEILKHEHRIILKVISAAQREAQAIQNTGKMHPAKLDQMVDFCQTFIDRCHHGKEEEYLFPKMEERGPLAAKGPIAVMLEEHAEGRRLVQAIAADLPQAVKGDSAALDAVAAHLSFYADLLQAHIDKENNVLFPMADKLFTPEDQLLLVQSFEKHEAEEMGEGTHERYHQLAHELAEDH